MPYAFGPKEALNFPQRTAAIASKFAITGEGSRALDIGCAVGGASFELSKSFHEVVGIDFSQVLCVRSSLLYSSMTLATYIQT